MWFHRNDVRRKVNTHLEASNVIKSLELFFVGKSVININYSIYIFQTKKSTNIYCSSFRGVAKSFVAH